MSTLMKRLDCCFTRDLQEQTHKVRITNSEPLTLKLSLFFFKDTMFLSIFFFYRSLKNLE